MIQSIRYLYGELRETVNKTPRDIAIISARTFDALDNAIKTLYNAQQVIGGGTFGVTLATFIFPQLIVGSETNHVFLSRAAVPSFVYLEMVSAGSVSQATFDIQISADNTTWKTILKSLLLFNLNVNVPTPVTSFAIATIPAGSWARAICNGPDITGKQATLQLNGTLQ